MSDSWYYDFLNPNIALKKALIDRGLLVGLHYVKDIASTAVSMFRYKNIEKIKGLTSEILETALMFNTNLCFYQHKSLGWVLCRYVNCNILSIYMKPDFVNLETLNGQSIGTEVPYKDIILVRDNALDIIPFICIAEYIQKMQNIDNAIERVLLNVSLPLAIVGSKKTANDLERIAKKIVSDPLIVGDDKLMDSVKAFPIDVPIEPTNLYELKSKYKNECLSSLGIYSVEEKRERKIVSEVASQNDFTDTIYQDRKTQRVSCFDEMNKRDPLLGIEVVETYRLNFKETVKETEELAKASGQNKPDKEVSDNEKAND